MNTNIVISLDTRRPKTDGSFPLIMRLGHQRKTIPIPLGISIKKGDWDEKKRIIKKTYLGNESITRLNNHIQKRKSEAMDIIVKLYENNQLEKLSITELKNRLHRVDTHQSFFKFTEQSIEDLKKANRFGTARSYKGVLSVLKNFTSNNDLTFKEITFQFLNRFETYHFAKGNSANGLSVYLRAIRAIYNKAVSIGIIEKEFYPFDSYKIKSVPTEKRALDWDFLKMIFKLRYVPDHPCFHARNYFVASYMLYGMNFADMALLKKTDVKDGRLVYRRKKTNKIYDIKVSTQLKKIFDFYSKLTKESEYIFPIVKRLKPHLQDKDILWARKRYNKKLKLIAEECGIEKNLTSYVSRHSFATQAMLQEVPLNAISTMLGHTSLKTTQVYLKSLPSTILDDYNEKILRI